MTFESLSADEMVDKLLLLFKKLMKRDWRQNWVIYPIPSTEKMKAAAKTAFIVFYKVEASLDFRVARAADRGIGLSEFIQLTGKHEKKMIEDNRLPITRTFVNNFETTEEFYEKSLAKFDFSDSQILRPSWDKYFMQLAYLVSTRTNCMKRPVGCVLVKNNRLVASGYNGTPFGMDNCNKGGCARCNTMTEGELDTCFCIHAEENAVIEGGRDLIDGGTAYLNAYPCLMDAKKLVQAGIIRIVFDRDIEMPGTRDFFSLLDHVSVE